MKAVRLKVWIDRESIKPGTHWKSSISRAIADGAFFVACFSDNYHRHAQTYMNVEVKVAMDVLAEHSGEHPWLIPVLLDQVELPEALRDIQAIDLSADWSAGIQSLLDVLLSPEKHARERARLERKEALECVEMLQLATDAAAQRSIIAGIADDRKRSLVRRLALKEIARLDGARARFSTSLRIPHRGRPSRMRMIAHEATSKLSRDLSRLREAVEMLSTV
jgi:hypothetical protein